MATHVTQPGTEKSADQQQGGAPSRPVPESGSLRADDKPALLSRPKARGLIFASVLVVVILGVLLLWYYNGRESTDDAEVDGHLAPISAKVSGNVVEVLVDDNQFVKAGQVLLKLDPRDYQEAVDQATAALALAKAHSEGANAGVPLQEETTQTGESSASADLQAALARQASSEVAYQKSLTSDLAYARAQVSKEQAAFDKAHNDVVRMRPLAEKAEISAQQFDGYVTTERQAEGDLESAKQKQAQAEQDTLSAKANLDAARSKIAAANAEVAQSKANGTKVVERVADAAAAKASVDQAQTDLDAAKLKLSYATVVAPVDGVVTSKTVEVGQVLQPGQGLLVVVPLNDVWVTANYKETQLKHVVPGQRAEVHVDMYGKTFTGHVDSIAGATGSRLSLLPPENATGNFVKVVQRIPVKIVLDPVPADKAILRPGMNVDATILTRSQQP
jgi:membrane fusion protein (multidrug efflux system)